MMERKKRPNIVSNMRTVIGVVVLIWCIFRVAISPAIAEPEYWPTDVWRVSSLEKQGMNPDRIIRMLEVIREKKYPIHSVTIIRNGYMVFDVYFPSVRKGKSHIIHSCAKSITSAIMGVAIDKGYIKNVNQYVIDYFPDKKFKNLDDRKRSIQIEHLLTMSSGIKSEDNFAAKLKWRNLNYMTQSDDWVQFGLNLPMDYAPGDKFEYSNISSFLLAAIIHKSTNGDVLEFAREYLFTPLGIKDISWEASPNGIACGWGEMYLTPHDMAKFGWLYLNKGKWENQQLISEKWIVDSTGEQISTGGIYRIIAAKYGYQWWITPNRYYMAIGYLGQRIIVVPEKNLVTVFTGDFPKAEAILEGILQRYILLSIESNTSIPVNRENDFRLKALLDAIE